MTTVLHAIEPVMHAAIGAAAARSVFRTLPLSASQPTGTLDVVEVREILTQLETSGRLFATPGHSIPSRQLREAVTGGAPAKPCEQRYPITTDRDVLVVQRATQGLTKGFFGTTDCVRLATAVSELARNIYMYAKQGLVSLRLVDEPGHYFFEVIASDEGPGIPHLDVILRGEYRSRTGLGRGLIGTKALLDAMKIDSVPGKGTRIVGQRRVRKA